MSKINDIIEDLKSNQILANILEKLSDLRAESPKLFYGGGVVLLIFVLILFSGAEQTTAPQIKATLSNGSEYIIHNPNSAIDSGGSAGSVLLIAVPGQFGSVDYSGEDDTNICLVQSGTRAVLEDETMINYIHYIKLRPVEGDCKGESGWTSKVNIKV